MKNIYFLLAAGLFISSCGPTTVIQQDSYESAPAPVADVSYQSFYDQLSPYGNWINYPGYGYVWMPSAGPDFRPYATNGNWIYTDAGWTWASNYNWGWAPFHYGRWFYEGGYGWMWVPGNEWAPAWVSWRGGGDYYGWAPLGPRISMDVALNNYNPPVNYWNFVPRQYMGHSNWHNYYVNQNQNVTIINNTTIINNYSGTNRGRYAYAPGPDPNEVRRYNGNSVNTVQLRQANTPGARMNGSQYMIYQPRVSATTAARGDAGGRPSTPAPARYESYNNVRPSTQYPTNNQPVNNPRPAMQNPANNQPVNNRPASNAYPTPAPANQPVNNPRPVSTYPSNNPPVNNPRPATTYPSNNPPVNNPRSGMENSPGTQPVNNRPPSNANPTPANRDPNNFRSERMDPNHPNSRPGQPVPVQSVPAPATTQTTGRPAANRNPNTNPPVNRQTSTVNPSVNRQPSTVNPKPVPQKPDEKPAEKPKTRQADNIVQ